MTQRSWKGFVVAVLAAGAAAGPVRAQAIEAKCKSIHADLEESRSTTGCKPGHAVCFLGTVDGNHGLRGTTYFRGDSSAAGPEHGTGGLHQLQRALRVHDGPRHDRGARDGCDEPEHGPAPERRRDRLPADSGSDGRVRRSDGLLLCQRPQWGRPRGDEGDRGDLRSLRRSQCYRQFLARAEKQRVQGRCSIPIHADDLEAPAALPRPGSRRRFSARARRPVADAGRRSKYHGRRGRLAENPQAADDRECDAHHRSSRRRARRDAGPARPRPGRARRPPHAHPRRVGRQRHRRRALRWPRPDPDRRARDRRTVLRGGPAVLHDRRRLRVLEAPG